MDAKLPTGAWVMPNEMIVPYVSDVGTFEELYRVEFPGLVAVATALTGDLAASEDLVQEDCSQLTNPDRVRLVPPLSCQKTVNLTWVQNGKYVDLDPIDISTP